MIKANVVLDNPIWEKKIKKPNNYIKKRLTILSKLSPFKNKIQEFTLFLTNSRKMKDLNNKFRKKNKTTNILSFPFYKRNEIKKKIKNEGRIYLGDIILNFYKIKKKARKNEFEKEFNKLWIHGLLHLLGYQHDTNKDFCEMRKLENRIFKQTEKTKC